MELIDTTEMYLRTIYQLRESGVVPMRARIAEQLGHSGPTVSQTVARMERDGLVWLGQDRRLELTDDGATKAMRVMRKHRLAERMLTEMIGLPWPKVHEEACRWEHVMSQEVERRLVTILPPPFVSPFGLPIPGLVELGVEPVAASSGWEVNSVARLLEPPATAGPLEVRLVMIGEVPQAESVLLESFEAAGLSLGSAVVIWPDPDGGFGIGLPDDGPSVRLTPVEGRHVLVSDS